MPSRIHGSGGHIELVEKKTNTESVVKPEPEASTLQSQEYLRDQLSETAVEPEVSMLLGSSYDSASEGATRGDTFLVGGKTVSSDLGRTTRQLSGTDLGSGRGDTFLVGGKTVSSDLGRTTKQLSGTDLGSGRGDTFDVGGKTLSSDLRKTTRQLSGTDLGSGRGDRFEVQGKSVSSDLGATTRQLSGTDLGSGRGDRFEVQGRSVSSDVGVTTRQLSGTDLGSGRGEPEVTAVQTPEAQLAQQIETNTVQSVSLPLMAASAELEQTGSVSPETVAAVDQAVKYEAQLLHVEDIPEGLLEALPKDTILRFAFSPEDMEAINLQAEHDAAKEVADVFTLNNPTRETMEHVLATGQFEDLIWSGHGNRDGLWITDTDGTAKLMPADDVAALLQDTGVQDVLLNVCDGGDKTDNALGRAGMNVFSNKREIIDETAVNAAVQFAENGNLLDIERKPGDGSRLMWEEKANFIDDVRDFAQRSGLADRWRQFRAGATRRSQAPAAEEQAEVEAPAPEIEEQRASEVEEQQSTGQEAQTTETVQQVLEGTRSDAGAVEEVATVVRDTKRNKNLRRRMRKLARRFRRR
jgi:hypothetical protein